MTRDRQSTLVITLAIVTIAAATLLGIWLWFKKLEYNNLRDYTPGQLATNAESICINIPPVISYCPEQQNTSDLDALRSDNDLKAQQEMADWAFLMAAISAVGFVLSTFGIVLIFVTFRATHRAAVAAQDANRPWIEIVITDKREFYIKPGLARIGIMVSLRNKGKSPATSVNARAALVAVPESGHEQFAAINQLEKILGDLETRVPNRGSTIFPGVDRDPSPFGGNIFREKLDKAVGGPDNKARFWLAVATNLETHGAAPHTAT